MSDVAPLDLSAAVPAETATIEIVYPGSGKPTGWKIELAGPAHPNSVELGHEIMRETLAKEARAEQAAVNGRKYKAEQDEPQERARRNVTRIVGRIVGWSPAPTFPQVSKEPLIFSKAVAIDLLMRPDMGWVLGQIADYLTSESAFTKGSAPN